MFLQGKVAIVTGAWQGIGKGIALSLAQEGCSVVVSDINQEGCEETVQELGALGVKAFAARCDVSSQLEVEALFERTIKTFGQVDIVVNNAGIYPFVSFADMTEADWDKVMNVNLKSIFFMSKESAKVLPSGGRIINISSIAAFVGFDRLAHYSASKAGINGLTRALALELAPKGITVNAIAPGPIETPGTNISKLAADAKAAVLANVPLGRMGTVEDIGSAAAFLASEKAGFITGQVLVVDGGFTVR